MLKRLVLATALLVPAAPAWALGIGTTLGVGSGSPFSFGAPNNIGTTANGFLPSLDFHFGDVALQIHVIELFASLTAQDFYVGANVYFGIPMGSIGGNWEAIIAPGAGLDLFFDPFAMGVTAESQFGVQLPGAASIGIYIVPALGVWISEGENVDLVAGGTLQMSIWFGGGGRKGGGEG